MAGPLLVGAAAFKPDDAAVAWLIETIRDLCPTYPRIYEFGELEAEDKSVDACNALADALEAQLTRGLSEPIELGHWEVEGLTGVLRDYHVQGHEEMTAFYYALRRFRGDPI